MEPKYIHICMHTFFKAFKGKYHSLYIYIHTHTGAPSCLRFKLVEVLMEEAHLIFPPPGRPSRTFGVICRITLLVFFFYIYVGVCRLISQNSSVPIIRSLSPTDSLKG